MSEQEDSIRDKLEELEQLKSNFIAIASHELRTPLGLILGHATFLYETIDEAHKRQLKIIIQNAERLKDVIDNMSKIEIYQTNQTRVRYELVDLVELIQEIARPFKEDFEHKGIHFNLNFHADSIFIDCEPGKISTALSNILDNALAFTDTEGSVTITTEILSTFVKISVMDTGIGIPPQSLHHVFDRFYQVENHLTRHHEGMGLGLSIAKAMVEAHQGVIWVDSKLGEGSTFSFLLPGRENSEGLAKNKTGAI